MEVPRKKKNSLLSQGTSEVTQSDRRITSHPRRFSEPLTKESDSLAVASASPPQLLFLPLEVDPATVYSRQLGPQLASVFLTSARREL